MSGSSGGSRKKKLFADFEKAFWKLVSDEWRQAEAYIEWLIKRVTTLDLKAEELRQMLHQGDPEQ